MYAEPLKAVTRKVNDNLIVLSCPFQIKGRLDVGGRMMAMCYDGDKIILYSALPYGDAVIQAFQQLTNSNGTDFNVTYLIVPNCQHNLVAGTYKQHFPNVKIIGSDKIPFADVKLTNDMANQVILKDKYSELGIFDKELHNNIELVYLSYHKNKEIVLFEKTSKSLFICDALFNLDSGLLEQYCPETGYHRGSSPLTGYSYLGRFLNPSSLLWKYFFGPRLNNLKTPAALEGLKLVSEWDFTRIEVVHGNPIDKDAKSEFKNSFGID